MTSLRHKLILQARRLGIEDSLRSVHGLRSRTARRDRRDGRQLRRLLSVLPEDASCIDVGANLGAVLREIVRAAPRGRHIAYEPLPELAAVLAREFPQVDVRAAAVSDHVGEATFYRHKARDTRSSLSPLEYGEGQLERFPVRLEDLDSSLPEDFVPALVKIDVEGAEEQVIRGAAQTLDRHRPTVVFEHNQSARHFGTSSDTLHGLLTNAGLRVFDIDGGGPYGPSEFAERADSGTIWTFVARR
jgi:FkbM family methyltransferase